MAAFASESVAALLRNRWPLCSGFSGRFGPEFAAYKRHEAASIALQTFEQGVIARSNDNIKAMRGAYLVGAFRVTELLAEQRRLVDAQREYTEALAERYRALADLQAALGVSIKQ